MNVDLEIEPGALLRRAEQLLGTRQAALAQTAFTAAEDAGADADACAAGRWMADMLLGEFEAAWRESDAIGKRGTPQLDRFWRGENLRGQRVIVRSLHGLGDAVQMLRYAPALAELAAEVTYEVAPPLLPLAPCFGGVGSVTTWGMGAPVHQPEWDVQVEITELPYLFRTTLADLPGSVSYLHLPTHEVRRVAERMGPRTRPRVGVVWACGDWNPSRNLPLGSLRTLVCNEAVEFWNLQGGTAAHEGTELGLQPASEICGDGLLPLAATIANLDLVLTPDTLAAHLAGALGVPAWVLLQYEADWRWMTGRKDSPWYPSLRLFRQPTPGDWDGAVAEVVRDFARFLRW